MQSSPPPPPLVTASPSWLEWFQALLVFGVTSVMFSAFASMKLDEIVPDFISEDDFATNRMKMSVLLFCSFFALIAWNIRLNRRFRHYAVYPDRLTVGEPANVVLPLERVTRVRVGAPMPDQLQMVHWLNERLGRVSRKNAHAADHLSAAYRNVVVIDSLDGALVIHVGTVERGAEVLAKLLELLPGRLAPSAYTENERACFGRFKPGMYQTGETGPTLPDPSGP